jgi:1-acyl-sn-glycerol-3-phosphate acyltransferase
MSFKKFFQSPSPEEFANLDWVKAFWRFVPHSFLDGVRQYTNLQTEGLEYVPKSGPVIVTPNHSGVLGWDALILQNEILKFRKRIPRTMSHNFWHQNPMLAALSKQFAYIPQDFKIAVRMLRRNNLLLLFPEAEAGNFKPSTQMYQLQPFNPGFVSLAVMTKAPIIPCAIIGAEESHLNLGTLDWTEKYIGAKLPLPLNLFPLPVQWKIIFLPPIVLDKYGKKEAKNILFLEEVAENIRMRIQKRIHKELVTRGVFKFSLDG